jgi:predicted metal-dependent phosphoesterase TrpH
VLTAIRKQNGLAIAPHPLNWMTRSLDEKTLLKMSSYRNDGLFFDAIETANTSSAAWAWVRKARKLNRTVLKLPEAGGSDAHFLKVIGSAYTAFDGSTADELRTSIATGNVRSRHGHHPGLLEIGPGQLARQTWRGLSTTPRTMGLRATAQSFVDRIFSRS